MSRAKFFTKEGTIKLATFFEIPVKVHWTFGLLLAFVMYSAFMDSADWGQAMIFVGFVFVLFLCVILHEYGHAIAARKFGVKTKDIILSPIGGVARLNNMPSKPAQELVIAIAGPFVNLVIFSTLTLILWQFTGKILPENDGMQFQSPLEFLRWVNLLNISLFVFNLIPAFPMDGGRVLRALLALKIGRVKATHLASVIGRILAVGFIAYGVYSQNLILSLIGLFIFMMAGKEYDQTKLSELVQTSKAKEVMRNQFTKLQLHDGYPFVIQRFHEGEKNFVVFDITGNPIGTLPELFIKDAIDHPNDILTIGERYVSNTQNISPDMVLDDIISLMKGKGIAILPVVSDGEVQGVIDRNDIETFIRTKIG